MSDNEEENPNILLAEEEEKRPLIVRKVRRYTIEEHGGSWKVAYADFATAMMAFFLLMWVIGATTKEQKQAISEYFNDPGGAVIGVGGANASIIDMQAPKVPELGDQLPTPETFEKPEEEQEGIVHRGALDADQVVALADMIERERLDKLKSNLEEEVETNPTFKTYKDQIYIDIVPDGLRIQVLDKENRAMFDSGGQEPKAHTRAMFVALARLISKVPNKVSITGHTDALPFVDRDDYSNWELSSDRANAARRALQSGGLPPSAVAKVEGFGASVLYDRENPNNPINRRIDIIVLKQSALDELNNNVKQIKEATDPSSP